MLLFDSLRPFPKLLPFINLIFLASGQGAHAQGTGGIPVVSVAYLTWDAVSSPEVAGYIIYHGTESGNYTHSIDVGNVTSGFIPDLIPGTTYFSAVTAYDAGRLESAFSNEVVFTMSTEPAVQQEGRLIFLEAEDGARVDPMYLGAEFEPPNFLEPSLRFVIPYGFTQEGTTTLTFDAPVSAEYHAWARVKGPGPESDSIFVSVDGGLEHVFGFYGNASPSEIIYSDAWQWSRIPSSPAGSLALPLTAGTHTLALRNREPGAALDCVVLSSDPNFTPSDAILGGADIVAITAQPQSESVSEGTSATLNVAAAANGPIAYQWEKDGTPIPGEAGPVLQLLGATTADSGHYTVIVTSGSVSVTSNPVLLVVDVPPPEIRNFEIVSGAGGTFLVSLEIEGALQSSLEVYASDDLEHWTPLGSQLNTTGTITLSDPQADKASRRFYRLGTP